MGHFFPTPGAILVWAFRRSAFVPTRDAIVYSAVECCVILQIQFISLPLGKQQTKLTLKNWKKKLFFKCKRHFNYPCYYYLFQAALSISQITSY